MTGWVLYSDDEVVPLGWWLTKREAYELFTQKNRAQGYVRALLVDSMNSQDRTSEQLQSELNKEQAKLDLIQQAIIAKEEEYKSMLPHL